MATIEHQSLFVRAKLVQMFDALERVGGTPIEGAAFHSFAFFVNVLSPLWDLHPFEGSVLKEHGSPFFPVVQRELDALVGDNLVTVADLSLSTSTDGGVPKLTASFSLAREKCVELLAIIRALPDEIQSEGFLLELADAFVAIQPELRDDVAVVDAAYSDPSIAEGRIVDFAEWVSSTNDNASWRVAQEFQRFVPDYVSLSRAEKLVMYMRLMKRRVHG